MEVVLVPGVRSVLLPPTHVIRATHWLEVQIQDSVKQMVPGQDLHLIVTLSVCSICNPCKVKKVFSILINR